MGARYEYAKFQAFDDDGSLLSGGKLYTYAAGTSTNKTTYSDVALTSANTNPVILNSRGEASVYGSGTYKFVLKDSDDTTVWTEDNVTGIGAAPSTFRENAYYVDSTATDQGAATAEGDRSLKDFVDSIGTSSEATIVFPRGSSGNSTTFTLSTSETVPSNITLFFERGAVLSVADSTTLTIQGNLEAGLYQIFTWTGSGNVVISGGVKEIFPQWRGFSPSATAAVNTTAFQWALDTVAGGTKIKIIDGDYSLNELTVTYKTSVIEGNGWNSVLTYANTSDFITVIGAHGGFAMRDLKIVGNSSAGHCINMDDLGVSGSLVNSTFDNLRIQDFNNTNKAAFYGKDLYNLRISNCYILDCYDGIYLSDNAINNEISNNMIRGWTRYGVAIIANPASGAYRNAIINNIIDEPQGSTGTSGIHFDGCYISVIEGNHFESETRAVYMKNALQNTVRNNIFSIGLTTTIELVSSAGDILVTKNRYNSGALVDGGNRTVFLFDHTAGDGGYLNSRVSIGTDNTDTGYFVINGGKGLHLLGRDIDGYGFHAPDEIQELTATTCAAITSTVAKVSASGATNMDGFAGDIPSGVVITLYFADNNTTIRHGQSGNCAQYFRLDGGANWNPDVNDSITLLKIDDGSFIELGRIDIS